ncbi:hypothetical protein VPNG_09103 [Cytospora leucostoma]|uniref:Uncharacterized protein n=1 Tax=Cytospora leucostoma TaxID=1230097 RepID=A0A423VP76_9PEZI|nr:hypothetical protein VPNG_09103 [Cytospora leucostoma]
MTSNLVPLDYREGNMVDPKLRSNSSREVYRVASKGLDSLENALKSFFGSHVTTPNEPFEYSLRNMDISAVVEHIAAELSAHIRSKANTQLEAYGRQAFIRVRWPWILVSVLEAVLTALGSGPDYPAGTPGEGPAAQVVGARVAGFQAGAS